MPNEPAASPIRVGFTPEFKRNLRALARKYRHIRSDVQPFIEQIQAGGFVGDQIAGVGYAVFKVRVRNSDVPKGKRSGYRLVYYLRTPTDVILVTIYSKSEQADVSAIQVRRILREAVLGDSDSPRGT
jgi:mRNA-degrading endonuclease RelE of RelBE toxin-antitoxin system